MEDEYIDPISDIDRALDQAQQERRDCIRRHLAQNKMEVKEEVWSPWHADLLIYSGGLHDGKMEIVAHDLYGTLLDAGLDCEIGDIRINTGTFETYERTRGVQFIGLGNGLCAVRLFFNGPTRGVIPGVPAVVNGSFVRSSVITYE
jgi:hypothetical protein